jgi:leader peptidase (prepilin peptidase)/N-methyltransferase
VFDLLLSPDLFPLHVAVVFVFGAVLGSFFNVCIYRIPVGQSVNNPRRSFCPACGTTIAWHDNVPMASWAALGGLCRHCGARISGRYFWIELLTALLFVGVFWVHRYSMLTPLFWLLTSFLIIATFTDLDHWIIPDSISLGGAAAGIGAALALSIILAATGWAPNLTPYLDLWFIRFGPWGIVAHAAAGAVFGYLLLWLIGFLGTLIFRKEAMGMGDMKLFACIGAFVGWQACIYILILSSFVGATLGISLIMGQWIAAKIEGRPKPAPALADAAPEGSGSTAADLPAGPVDPLELPPPRARQLHHLPFGPYIAVAAYIVMLFYPEMYKWVQMNRMMFQFF